MGRRGFLSQSDRMDSINRHDGKIPTAPKGLSPAAKREWRRVTRLLAARGVIDSLDRAVLEGYIALFQDIPKLEAEIERTGRLLKNRHDEAVKNPLLGTLAAYRTQLLAYLRELGATPASRVRLALPKPRETGDNPWQRLFDPVPKERESPINLAKYKNLRPLPGDGNDAA